MKRSVEAAVEKGNVILYLCRDAAAIFPNALALYVLLVIYLHSSLAWRSNISEIMVHMTMLVLTLLTVAHHLNKIGRLVPAMREVVGDVMRQAATASRHVIGMRTRRKVASLLFLGALVLAIRAKSPLSDLVFLAALAYVPASNRSWTEPALKAGIACLVLAAIISALHWDRMLIWTAILAFDLLTIGTLAAWMEAD